MLPSAFPEHHGWQSVDLLWSNLHRGRRVRLPEHHGWPSNTVYTTRPKAVVRTRHRDSGGDLKVPTPVDKEPFYLIRQYAW